MIGAQLAISYYNNNYDCTCTALHPMDCPEYAFSCGTTFPPECLDKAEQKTALCKYSDHSNGNPAEPMPDGYRCDPGTCDSDRRRRSGGSSSGCVHAGAEVSHFLCLSLKYVQFSLQ